MCDGVPLFRQKSLLWESCNGPALHRLYSLVVIDDLVVKMMNVSLFTDDTTIYMSGGNIAEILRVLQEAADVIHDRCNVWCFRVSALKSHLVVFTRTSKQ